MDDLIDDETKPVGRMPGDLLPDGIYLHLDESEYHAQPRLSASGVNKLRVSEADFWVSSWLNPDKEEKTTDAMTFGRAFHTARLEPSKFKNLFVRDLDTQDMPDGCLFNDTDVKAALKELAPKPEDHPDALRTDTDVKAALAECGQAKTVTGETAEDRKDRLRAASAGVLFWSDIVAEFENENGPISGPAGENTLDRAYRLQAYGYTGKIWAIEKENADKERGDRVALPAKVWDQIVSDVAEMHGTELAQKYLTGGLAEVSVLWTDDRGVRWKSRIDYLRPDIFTDAKTFVNQRGKAVRECLTDAFRYNGYFIQAQVYREAVDQIRAGNLTLIDALTDEETAIIDQIVNRPYPLLCVYLFQQKEGVPNVMAGIVRLDTLAPGMDAASSGADEKTIEFLAGCYSIPTQLSRKASSEIEAAVNLFLDCDETYAPDEKWRPLEPEFEIDDDSFNPFWLDPNFNDGDIK